MELKSLTYLILSLFLLLSPLLAVRISRSDQHLILISSLLLLNQSCDQKYLPVLHFLAQAKLRGRRLAHSLHSRWWRALGFKARPFGFRAVLKVWAAWGYRGHCRDTGTGFTSWARPVTQNSWGLESLLSSSISVSALGTSGCTSWWSACDRRLLCAQRPKGHDQRHRTIRGLTRVSLMV